MKWRDVSSHAAVVSRLNALMNEMPNGVVMVESKRRVTYMNPVFKSIFNIPSYIAIESSKYCLGELDSKLWQWVLSQIDNPDGYHARVADMFESLTYARKEVVRLKDGRVLVQDFAPIFNEGTHLVGYFMHIEDVTEEHRLQEELKDKQAAAALRRYLQCTSHDMRTPMQTIAYAAEMLIELHRERKTRRRLLRHSDEDVPVPVLGAKETRLAANDVMGVVRAGGSVSGSSSELLGPRRRTDRSSSGVQVDMGPWVDADEGDVDIENLHELKLLQITKSSVAMVELIVENVLDTQKIETGIVPVTRTSGNLCLQIKRLLGVLQVSTHRKTNVQLVQHISPNVPSMVVCDNARIARIILNLVVNALKFTQSGTVTVTIAPADPNGPAAEPGDMMDVEFSVEDTGCGMTEETISQCCTAYVSASQRDGGGSGLGLYICRASAAACGGELKIESAVGKGTKMSFVLPLEVSQQRERRSTNLSTGGRVASRESMNPNESVKSADSANSGGGVVKFQSSTSLNPDALTVLVCEDNVVNRTLLCRTLASHGVLVKAQAEDGQQAVDALYADTYDLVFMDINMPVYNGDEVVRMYRAWELAHRPGTRVWICALTGNVSVEDKQLCLESGCDDFMAKPLKSRDLASYLKMMREKKAAGELGVEVPITPGVISPKEGGVGEELRRRSFEEHLE
mmetsp:Transcript_37869/g.119490  ORF Transcript_37869/g.119490 Transcript_37869/m.119490 type:complete len:684 (-) Transcript_37869:163-2214(-)